MYTCPYCVNTVPPNLKLTGWAEKRGLDFGVNRLGGTTRKKKKDRIGGEVNKPAPWVNMGKEHMAGINVDGGDGEH